MVNLLTTELYRGYSQASGAPTVPLGPIPDILKKDA